ncbi:MAG: HEAT repeat domain-containing protein [Acidobacteria bacterium]|nr:HEAT repeat domain-containing protein [Acidobacteriota bacterium]
MSIAEILPKKCLFIAAANLAFLFSHDMLLGKPVFSADPPVFVSAEEDRQSKGFEEDLKALNSDNIDEKHRAAIALGKTGNPRAVEPLIKALADPDTFVRSFAAVSLGNLKDARAVEPLIKALGDENQRVRRSAVEALGSLRDPKALEALLKLLNDENVLVRRSAAQALGNLGNPDVVDPLLKALGDKDSYIWTGASFALIEIGSPGIPKMVNLLGDWIMGPRVAEVLASLAWQPASDEEKIRYYAATRNRQALLDNWVTARKVLISDVNSGDARLAENAVFTLIGIGREEILDDLAGFLRTKGNLETAKAFLESGHARLTELAQNWATGQGKEIETGGTDGVVKWGLLKPE